jgi:outer membrane protein
MVRISTEDGKNVHRISGRMRGVLALLVCLVVSAVASAQNSPSVPVNGPITRNLDLLNSSDKTAASTARLITLEEAKQQAAGAQNPMVRLGELSVEVAKQNRQAFQSQYFPVISATFANLHFNKFMGEQFQLNRPILGTTVPVSVPLLRKDETVAAFNVIQPLTPLLKVQQAVKIARADENIARAKAGMPVSEAANKVEKNYFALLIAQRELIVARMKTKSIQDKYLIASNAPPPRLSAEQEAEMIGAEKTLVIANSKVQELSATLNGLIGFPVDTELDLVAPTPFGEGVSLAEATEKAMATNPEVVEAEQTAIKARAGRKLAKLDYIPDVAVLGGYAYQTAVPLLPNDFSYVGVMATFTVFDSGKREHTLKMRNAQVEMAELAVVLTKAKVAASVKTSYFEMDRSRALSQLSQRIVSSSLVVNAGYQPNSSEVIEVRAKLEADMFQAELAYREAFARLKTLMGDY